MSLSSCVLKLNAGKTVFQDDEVKAIQAVVNKSLNKLTLPNAERAAVQQFLDQAIQEQQTLSEAIAKAMSSKSEVQQRADINSGKSFVNRIKSEIAKWVAQGTNNGTKPMDTKWERNAVKRFAEANINPQLSGKQIGNRASAKIAIAKSETFVDLAIAIEKYADKDEKQSAKSAITASDLDPTSKLKSLEAMNKCYLADGGVAWVAARSQ